MKILRNYVVLIAALSLAVNAGLWSGIKNLYYEISERQRILDIEFLEEKESKKLSALEENFTKAKKELEKGISDADKKDRKVPRILEI